MSNKDVRRTLNVEAQLHLDSLKHSNHISETLLDDQIARDMANQDIPDPSDDFREKASDILGDDNLEADEIRIANRRLAAKWERDDVIYEDKTLDQKLAEEARYYDLSEKINGRSLAEILQRVKEVQLNSKNLVSAQDDVNHEYQQLIENVAQDFLVACRAGNFQLVRSFVEEGVDIQYKNGACLLSTINGFSTYREKVAIIRFLLENNATLKNTDDTLLTVAVRAQDIKLVKYFLSMGISPNQDDGTGLFEAILNEQTEIFFYLMKAGGIVTKDLIDDMKECGLEVPLCLHQIQFLQGYIHTHPMSQNHNDIDVDYIYQHATPCRLLDKGLLGVTIDVLA